MNSERSELEKGIFRYTLYSFQGVRLMTLAYFTWQTVSYVKMRRSGSIDFETALTLAFLGLMFVCMILFMICTRTSEFEWGDQHYHEL